VETTAAEALVIDTAPTENTVITDKTLAMILVLMVVFFILFILFPIRCRYSVRHFFISTPS
jgi:hypothetical protein